MNQNDKVNLSEQGEHGAWVELPLDPVLSVSAEYFLKPLILEFHFMLFMKSFSPVPSVFQNQNADYNLNNQINNKYFEPNVFHISK